ncbi:MAG: hypothetical protein JNK82_25110 [Myxococcaceae bacterium]|nr:hypothetical protein [Myxococcaceae bacterium]
METNEPAVDADDPMKAFQERLGPKLKDAEAQVMELNEKVKSFIRQNPGTCLMGALALGFVVGRLASRR